MKTRSVWWLAGGLALAWLGWRLSSRRRQMPCPAWLAWILENPLTEAVAAAEVTLDRIGLQPGERGLDVGCGPGRIALPAAQRVSPTDEIVAVDVQPAMLARLQERLAAVGVRNVIPRQSDIAAPDALAGEQFDRAWLVTVLGEIPDRQAALRNVYRLLRPGGVLSITEIFPDPHYQRRATVLRLGREAGFIPTQRWGAALAFTQNFVRPDGAEQADGHA